ncbi:hypothetical protein RRG08_024059 [Elysia crispata]|uniref:Uncharacterized protein n=1 Tax=Elysia crispata TaxID=231223 RepID=A0AAE1DJC6_9GAST|nr:hypothetical protein RRG08_024059 [Elysia crispata]
MDFQAVLLSENPDQCIVCMSMISLATASRQGKMRVDPIIPWLNEGSNPGPSHCDKPVQASRFPQREQNYKKSLRRYTTRSIRFYLPLTTMKFDLEKRDLALALGED